MMTPGFAFYVAEKPKLLECLDQKREIFLVFRSSRSPLVLDEIFEANIAEWEIPRGAFELHVSSSPPRRIEVDPIDFVQEIDPIGWYSELEDDSAFFEFGWTCKLRDLSLPELFQSLEKTCSVLMISIIVDVDIAGHANVAVENDCFSTDNHESHVVGMQCPKEILNIGGKCRSVYDFRWHSRTSRTGSGNTRIRSSRDARMRS